MEKLDRQGWAVGISLRAYGLRIGIRANSDQALSEVLDKLPPVLSRSYRADVDMLYSVVAGDDEPGKRFRRYSLAYANGTQLARSKDFELVLAAIESHLSLYLAEFAKNQVFIHAGVVGWKGRAVVIPGRSHAGKSTLVSALLRAGAAYYSDEFAVVDRLGRVHPYARPIQLRNGDGTSRRLALSEFPARVGRRSLPVALILATYHRAGAEWRPRRVSPGQGLLALLTNTVSAQLHPERALATLKMMVTGAQTLKGARGEADATVKRLRCQGHLPG